MAELEDLFPELKKSQNIEDLFPELAVNQGTVIDEIAEPAKAIAGGITGATIGGLEGLARAPFQGVDKAVEELQKTQQFFASQPETELGKRGLQIVENSLSDLQSLINSAAGGVSGLLNVATNPISNVTQGFEPAKERVRSFQDRGLEKSLGEDTFEVTGSPLAATGAELLPSIAEIATGRAATAAKTAPQKLAPTELDDIVNAGAKNNVPVLTTDVFPPESFMGRHIQRISEKLGPLGSGTTRTVQQKARENVVQNLADEFDVSLDSPFLDEIVRSVSVKNAKKLEIGNARRRKAIDSLVKYGEVPTLKTSEALNDIAEKQARLKGAARPEVLNDAQRFADAANGQDFDGLAAVRTNLIKEIKDIEGSSSEVKSSRLSALNEIKKAIDEDMKDFAQANNETALNDWLKANKFLAEELTNVKQTELKRIIDKGDVKPELVSTILKGGKRSELERLNKALTPKGRASARAAIIQDALTRSGFLNGQVNPNKLATELGRKNALQAVDVFFTDRDKAQLKGLQRLLDATRRAQDAPATLETGQQLIPLVASSAIGAGLTQAPITTLLTASTASALAKSYESKPFRNLMLRLNRTKKGSKQERQILSLAVPAVIAAMQAAKTEQLIESIPE